jgi:tetratricopeptide (TPR) repeat protein
MGKFRRHSEAQAIPWIYNPWLDLIIGCGGWSAPLLLISYFSLASSTRIWAVAFYVLALFFNYPHYMATIYRAYHRAEDFEKYRVFTVHITALMLLTLVLSHVWLRLLPWIFTLYLTWSPWHYSGQNYGLFMMFARRAGANPDKTTTRALYGAFIASYLILFLSFHTGPSSDPLFLSLGIPPFIGKWEQVVLGAAFIVLSIFGFSRLARATEWKRLIPCITLFSSQFLWFFLPAAISLIKGLSIPQNRYSTGVLAVMHSAQYLWITSYYAKRETANPETSGASRRKWRPLAYFGVLILGGIALFVPGPWMASRAFHHDFTASFLIFTALVNIHHFILDGAIWKLRDGRVASLLLNSRDRIASAASDAGGSIVTAARWLVGDSTGARTLRVSAAVLLLVWGSVDQVRYYLSLRTDDLADLQRAADLDAFDSSLQIRLARRAMEDNRPQLAEAAWKRAIAANPADPAPRHGFLELLIHQKRYDDAYQFTEASLRYLPKDANLLFDRGVLALQRGKADEARADWELALASDPGEINAHLYLATELDNQGKAREAAQHYAAYIEKAVQKRSSDRPDPRTLIALIMRMADCQARSSQIDLALRSYHLAERLAVETHNPKLQSIADINEAAAQAKAGRISASLPLYQEALQIDTATQDRSAGAEDWLSYAQFLDNSGFPPRLAYACVTKSDEIRKAQTTQTMASKTETETGKTSEPQADDTATALRQSLERRLGKSAGPIRKDPGPVLAEALQLRP